MKVRTNAVVNQSTVTLDAAALAADLSEALQLRVSLADPLPLGPPPAPSPGPGPGPALTVAAYYLTHCLLSLKVNSVDDTLPTATLLLTPIPQAEGAMGGQLLEREAQLQEMSTQLAVLQRQAAAMQCYSWGSYS